MRGDGVRQAAGVVDAGDGGQDLGGIFLLSLTYWSNCCITARRSASISLDCPPQAADRRHRRGGGRKCWSPRRRAVGPRALLAFTSTFTVPSGSFSICRMVDTQPTSNMSVRRGVVLGRGLLRHQHDAAVGSIAAQRLDALGAPRNRGSPCAEHHHVAQRQQRQGQSGDRGRGHVRHGIPFRYP